MSLGGFQSSLFPAVSLFPALPQPSLRLRPPWAALWGCVRAEGARSRRERALPLAWPRGAAREEKYERN